MSPVLLVGCLPSQFGGCVVTVRNLSQEPSHLQLPMDGQHSLYFCFLLNTFCPSSSSRRCWSKSPTWRGSSTAASITRLNTTAKNVFISLVFSLHLGFVKLISDSQESKTMVMLMSVRYLQAEAAEVPFAGSNSINVAQCWSAVSLLSWCLTLLSTQSALIAVLPDTASHEKLHDDFICLPVYYPLGSKLRLVNVFSYKCSNPDI